MAVTYNLKGTTNSSFKIGKQGAGTLETGAIDASGNTGSVASVTGHLVPSANVTYDLGTSNLMWRDIYVGPGSIYVNGKKVIEDNSGTITVSTDADQNLAIATSGTGQTTIQSAAGLNLTTTSTGDITFTTASGQINFDGDVIVNAAKSISSSNADPITFADPISVTGNSEMANLTITGNLTVQGTTTTIDSTTVQIQNAFKFEGATADDFETTLTVTDPTADRTITLPDATGTVVLADATQTLTNKTIDSASNTLTLDLSEGTLTGTTAEFNTALSDGSFATLAGTETLTNKTLGATTISGHLTPSANVTYDLGTSSLRFRDIYLSGTTIDLGGAKLTNDGSDNLDIKDGAGNRKTIRASSIELVDSTGKIMRLERDASSGKLKQSRKNSDGSDEGSSDTLDIIGDTSPQLGGTLDANGNDIDMGSNTITDTKVGQWDTAYGWGDHSTQDYLSGDIGFPTDLGLITGSTTDHIGLGPDMGSIASGDTFVGLVKDFGFLGDTVTATRFTTAASDPASASEGDVYYNTTDNLVYIYNGSQWGKVTPNYFLATGGTTYTFGLYTVHAFTSTGTFSVTGSKSIDYLVVAGGGAGGGETSGASAGGGGGGGGLVYVSGSTITTGDYTVTVGAGGTGGTGTGGQGGNSSFNSTIAYGGGGGAIGNSNVNAPTYTNYGGGGGGSDDGLGAAATSQGNAGGDGSQSGSVGSPGGTGNGKAGGGGGGGDGNTLVGNPGGAGGDGVDYSSTFGTSYGENGVFSGGGAGGNGDPGTDTILGGLGGGGDAGAGNGGAGTANTGGGGAADQGGTSTSNGGNGGSGIVLIRYLT